MPRFAPVTRTVWPPIVRDVLIRLLPDVVGPSLAIRRQRQSSFLSTHRAAVIANADRLACAESTVGVTSVAGFCWRDVFAISTAPASSDRGSPTRVPHDFPEMAIGIGEIAGVPTPERLRRGLDDRRAGSRCLRDDFVDLLS